MAVRRLFALDSAARQPIPKPKTSLYRSFVVAKLLAPEEVKMSAKVLLSMLLTGVLAACGPSKVQLANSFNPAEVAFALRPGTGQISGQAFLKTMGGDVKTAAGNSVALVPAGSYARERMNAIYGSGNCSRKAVDFGPPDPAFEKSIRTTTADGDGRFRFENLSAGQYFVATTISWMAPTQYGVSTQGCKVLKLVDLAEGQKADIVLTSQ